MARISTAKHPTYVQLRLEILGDIPDELFIGLFEVKVAVELQFFSWLVSPHGGTPMLLLTPVSARASVLVVIMLVRLMLVVVPSVLVMVSTSAF